MPQSELIRVSPDRLLRCLTFWGCTPSVLRHALNLDATRARREGQGAFVQLVTRSVTEQIEDALQGESGLEPTHGRNLPASDVTADAHPAAGPTGSRARTNDSAEPHESKTSPGRVAPAPIEAQR